MKGVFSQRSQEKAGDSQTKIEVSQIHSAWERWRQVEHCLLIWLACSCAALAEPASLTVGILSPTQLTLSGNELSVVAKVTSTFELKTVVARVEDRAADLSFSPNAYTDRIGPHPGWVGTVSLAGLARGAKRLVVEATDFLGNASQGTTEFTYDRKPILKVTSPLGGTVARPHLRITASAEDDDPAGCIIRVTASGAELLWKSGQVDESVDLSRYDGAALNLRFEAIDSAGQRASWEFPVYVETSPRLTEVETVPGAIWSLTADRMLFLESAPDRGVLKIRHRPSGADTLVLDQVGRFPRYGALTPDGAIFIEQSGPATSSLVTEWRSGVLLNHGAPNSTLSLVVRGDYAIWNDGTRLLFRDLRAGTTATLSSGAGNWKNDLAPNGDVVFWGSDYNVYRFRAGKVAKLPNASGGSHVYPLTDGTWVVSRQPAGCCGLQGYGLGLSDGTVEIELTPLAGHSEPEPWIDYQINNAWVAFTRAGTGGQAQVWTRSPEGAETQLTFYGDSSRISALAPNGQVMLLHNRRYLSRPGQPLTEINSVLGDAFWDNEQWWIKIGRTLFAVRPDTQQPALSQVRMEAGRLAFRVSAGDGQAVTIQTSPDLLQWTKLDSMPVSGGRVEFVDQAAGLSDRRFYRAVSP